MNKEPRILSKKCFGLGNYACNFTDFKNGEIIVPVSHAEGRYLLVSNDNGLSFEKKDVPECYKEVGFQKLSDGTYMAFGIDSSAFRSIYNADNYAPFCLAVYRAKSSEDIFSGNVETSFRILDIPGLHAGYGDSGNRHGGVVTGWRQLSNGDIYMTMYGQFKDDTTLCPYFTEYGNYKFYLYRTWAMVSHDMGKTFSFVTTIADCQTNPIKDINAEGYCEADIEEVEPGHIVCILRTGGHEVYSPLYCSHSYDFGNTWSAPYEICDWGVLPRLLKLQDGRLVIASGHIHNMLLFSDDSGKTWSKPFIVEFCDGKWGNSPSGYNSVFECSPGVISLVYDDPKEGIAEGGKEGKVRKIYHVTIEV